MIVASKPENALPTTAVTLWLTGECGSSGERQACHFGKQVGLER